MEKTDKVVRGNRVAILHKTWKACILMKGIYSLLEIGSACMVWQLKPGTLGLWLRAVTAGELAEDPNDLVANWALQATNHYSVSVQHFAAFYLLAAGLINIIMVILLWRKKSWAYPLMAGFLALFIAYQSTRWFRTHSMFLIVLNLFDVFMIWLTFNEYSQMKSRS